MQSFKTLIHEFGEQLNAEGVEADEQGYIALTFDSQVLHLQYDEQQDEVVVFTRLGEMASEHTQEICLMLLGANLFWQGTEGATFSVEPTSGKVFLADRQHLSLMNVNRLNDWLERFLNITNYWNERLCNANAGNNLEDEPDVASGLSNYII